MYDEIVASGCTLLTLQLRWKRNWQSWRVFMVTATTDRQPGAAAGRQIGRQASYMDVVTNE